MQPIEIARQRATILRSCDLLVDSGRADSWAVAASQTAMSEGIAVSTLYRWRAAQAAGSLQPRRRSDSGAKRTKYSPEAEAYLLADYCRPEQPRLSECFERLKAVAIKRGWDVPSLSTVRLRLKDQPPGVVAASRIGAENLVPRQERCDAHLSPHDEWNADAHRLDVFVDWNGTGKRKRIYLHAFQDSVSRAIVGWHLSETECSDGYRLAFGMACRNHGAPKTVRSDNGTALMSDALTGGAAHTFKKKRKSKAQGIITQVVGPDNVKFALPYSPESKRVERAFQNISTFIGKHPMCHGAYTGKDPSSKPSNYGSRLVSREDIQLVVEAAVAHWNNLERRDGQSPMMRLAGCRKRTISQPLLDAMRYCHKTVTALHRDGSFRLLGCRYWAAGMLKFAGSAATERRVNVRFEPSDLRAVSVVDGHDLIRCERIESVPYDSAEGARESARARRKAIKAINAAAADLGVSPAELEALAREAAEAKAGQGAKALGDALESADSTVVIGAFNPPGMVPELSPVEAERREAMREAQEKGWGNLDPSNPEDAEQLEALRNIEAHHNRQLETSLKAS